MPDRETRTEIVRRHRTSLRTLAGAGIAVAAVAAAASALSASTSFAAGSQPKVPAGYTIAKVAAMPKGAGSCDDLAFLDGKLYTGCQNATFSNGGGGSSTLVEVGLDGTIVKTWSIKDKIDGVGSDPRHHRIIVTLNEDAHSRLATVTPSAPAARQLTLYKYTPDIGSTATPAALHTGGGTDNVSVDAAGNILITGSHATQKSGTAVFVVKLAPPAGSGGIGTATLTPTFADNATAAKDNHGSGTTQLNLTDVDSGAIVPASVPKLGGSYVIDDQTALQLVIAKNIFAGSGLTVLKLPYGLDDLRWATANAGTLYAVDLGAGTPGKSAIYKVTGPFATNTVFASNDSIGDQIVTVDMGTGAVKPFVRGLNTTKGLVYLNPSGSETQLALTGAPEPAATPPAATSTGAAANKSGSSDTALIIALVVAAILVIGAGGFGLTRRLRTA